MTEDFPAAVPEIPVKDLMEAACYYEKCLGFSLDWGRDDGGIAQVSRGNSRLFLTDQPFRASNPNGNSGPMILWFNLDNRQQVDELHSQWSGNGARIFYPPAAKPWHLYEFAAQDLDGNMLRVFYDFAWELPDRGGRQS
ncbi:MAG TPA: VOC family protein [Candidatus Acidoferrum sp.]|nr:VOC family protein [Candidatus Acidoferrum sp.]